MTPSAPAADDPPIPDAHPDDPVLSDGEPAEAPQAAGAAGAGETSEAFAADTDGATDLLPDAEAVRDAPDAVSGAVGPSRGEDPDSPDATDVGTARDGLV